MEQPYEFEKTLEYKGVTVRYKVENGFYYIPQFQYGFRDRASALRALALKLELDKLEEFEKRERSLKRKGVKEGIYKRGYALESLKRDKQEWADK